MNKQSKMETESLIWGTNMWLSEREGAWGRKKWLREMTQYRLSFAK